MRLNVTQFTYVIISHTRIKWLNRSTPHLPTKGNDSIFLFSLDNRLTIIYQLTKLGARSCNYIHM